MAGVAQEVILWATSAGRTVRHGSKISKRPGWISHSNGVEVLLDHLRQHLGQPHLSEMAEYLAKYFKNSRRRRHESMNDYITRACQTLNRVQKRYEPKSHGLWAGSYLNSISSAGTSNLVRSHLYRGSSRWR